MTRNRGTKHSARDLSTREGIPYSAARRRLAEPEQSSEPPRLYPIVLTPCAFGCDGTGHPGHVCETWAPFTSRGQARSGWDTCQAASLPKGRADSLTWRFRPKSIGVTLPDQSWLLAVVYALLLEEEPDLAPDPQRLREAVEADDLAAVDALLQPLDIAAVRLLGVPAEQWWNVTYPRVHAWAQKTVSTPADEPHWDMTLIEYNDRCYKLAQRWLRSREERPNLNGYMEPELIQWWYSEPFLTRLLMQQLGGHPTGSEVQLRNGRRMTIRLVYWGQAGHPPVAYDVREVGAPPFPLENERVGAEEIEASR